MYKIVDLQYIIITFASFSAFSVFTSCTLFKLLTSFTSYVVYIVCITYIVLSEYIVYIVRITYIVFSVYINYSSDIVDLNCRSHFCFTYRNLLPASLTIPGRQFQPLVVPLSLFKNVIGGWDNPCIGI